ncbi:MAG: 16S rRNA processing protein RimM [Chloroflexi bacterium]|nr:16S rRNA processing protein RimM [Chloroflexota bacterium]
MSDPSSNSPNSPANDLISVGRILGAHGRDGEIRVRATSDVPDRFEEGRTLFISKDGIVAEEQTYRIARSRTTVTKGSVELILAFEDFYDRDLAMRLAGYLLCVEQSEVPEAEEGEYFHYQLLGLKVRTVDGEDLGELAEILETGANDVYVIAGGEKDLLVPALSNVVREINIDTGLMVVDLPEGLR